jgi:hypothetical protein
MTLEEFLAEAEKLGGWQLVIPWPHDMGRRRIRQGPDSTDHCPIIAVYRAKVPNGPVRQNSGYPNAAEALGLDGDVAALVAIASDDRVNSAEVEGGMDFTARSEAKRIRQHMLRWCK